MTTKRKTQIGSQGGVNQKLQNVVEKAQNEAITLDQAIESVSSKEKLEETNDLLEGLEEANFSLRRLRNRKPKMFILDAHLVVSARALLLLWTTIVGILILLLKLFGH